MNAVTSAVTTDLSPPDDPLPDDRPPQVVVWEADGSPHSGVGYGRAIAARLAARGIPSVTVPLPRRPPSDRELAADVHLISGGRTDATSDLDWVRAARHRLAQVLERARDGRASVTGICFGAQLIAATLAGPEAVGPNPRGMEAGLRMVRPPDGGPGSVVAELHYHEVRPEAVERMGGNLALTNEHTTVQAYTVGSRITGLQFHPELDPVATWATVRSHHKLLREQTSTAAAALASIRHHRDRWHDAPFRRWVAEPAARETDPEQVSPTIRLGRAWLPEPATPRRARPSAAGWSTV